MSAERPLVLVDGSSYLYRAYHALPPLATSAGEPTGAIHGVLNMLLKLLAEYEPENAAVVFDVSRKTFRSDLYEDYKANRPPMPDELRAQIEPLVEAIEALGVPVLRIDGVEADDVIGTLARGAARDGIETVISTTDKDMAQLVETGIVLVNTMSDTKLDTAGVVEKYGVPPERIVDYLSLVGDTSDNVPGVAGVGPKTAVKWLDKYGTLEALTEHADEIGGKIGERLRETLPELPLYRELVTIRADVDLPVERDALKRREIDLERLQPLLERLEMRSLLRRVGGESAAEPAAPAAATAGDYETVLTEAELDAWLERLEAARIVAIDTETTSLSYMAAELVGISLADAPGRACYIPVAHRYAGAPDQLERKLVLDKLKPWLESAEQAKVGHHLKYDAHVLANYRVELRGITDDTMLESYVFNSTATRHDMDSVAGRYLNVTTTKYEDVAGKGAKQIRFDEVDVATASSYASEDADITLRLHNELSARLAEIPDLERIYRELEIPLLGVLLKMEHAGVMVDTEMLAAQSRELAEAMAETERAAHAEAGQPFNLGSTKQLQEILYEKLALPVLAKTPKGAPSTAESVLAELAESYELPRLVLEYRGLSKLKSTYTDKLPEDVDARTGRIHTSYHQAVAATGRLSSSDPNLQNIPIRRETGRRIRKAFVAPPGQVLIAADYSQIELRIMAHLSGDKGLLEAFRTDKDIHRATAAEVFGAALEDVTSEQRRSAKAINFGLIYGMSAYGLARQLGVERGEASGYVDAYFERYPGVKRYMDETRELAREQGYVSTVFGRRLYLPEINARNAQRRQYAERSAINAPMQGTAADIIKRAMLAIDAWLTTSRRPARLIMQVHDELIFEAEAEAAAEIAEQARQIMEQAAELSVPLKVEAGIGANWDAAH